MVKPGQEHQLAMPVLCPTALLFRRWLSPSNRSWATRRHPTRIRNPATAGVVPALRLYFDRRSSTRRDRALESLSLRANKRQILHGRKRTEKSRARTSPLLHLGQPDKSSLFYDLVPKIAENPKPERFTDESIEADMYMSLWYGEIYVVIEGYQELKLSDPTVDAFARIARRSCAQALPSRRFSFSERLFRRPLYCLHARCERPCAMSRRPEPRVRSFFPESF